MSITIADKTQMRRTTSEINHSLPNCLASVAWTNPTALCIDTAGASYSGQPQVKPAYGVNGRLGYVGMSHEYSVAVGKAISPQRNLIIAGYAGVSVGLPVFLDDVGSDASGTASGLTHTAPTSGTLSTLHLETPQEAAVSATQSFELIAPTAGTITALKLAVATTITTSDTNYWTFGLVNKTQTLTAVDATAAANSTKATGGIGITAYTPTALTLSGTGSNLVVAAGDVLEITVTKASSAANLVEFLVDLSLSVQENARSIGMGWGTDRIFFF